jgi:hypothetical protein
MQGWREERSTRYWSCAARGRARRASMRLHVRSVCAARKGLMNAGVQNGVPQAIRPAWAWQMPSSSCWVGLWCLCKQLQALNNTGSAFCWQARRHYRVHFSCTLIAHMCSLEIAPHKFCQPHHSHRDDGRAVWSPSMQFFSSTGIILDNLSPR